MESVRRYDPLSWEYPSWASINGPAVNILKGALVASDRIVTVSQVRPGFQTTSAIAASCT